MRLFVGTHVGPFYVGASERVGASRSTRAYRRRVRSEAHARAWRDGGPVYRIGLVAWVGAIFALLGGLAFPPLFALTVIGMLVGLGCAGITGAREARRTR